MYRTVIVEDDPMIASINQTFLSRDPRFSLAAVFHSGQEALEWLRKRPVELLILDVREQDEYDSGHIPGAKLLPLSTIRPASAAQIIPNKDQAVLVYCHSGRRSRKACLLLSKLGYTHICDLGGILDWPYEKE